MITFSTRFAALAVAGALLTSCALMIATPANAAIVSDPAPATPAVGGFEPATPVTLAWSAATATNGVATYTVYVSSSPTVDGNGQLTNVANQYFGTATSSSFALADGAWYWEVRAWDDDLSPSAWSGVSAFTVDTENPVVAITSTAPTAAVAASDPLPFTATITDVNPDSYQVLLDGAPFGAAGSGASVAGPLDISTVSPGAHSFSLQATDKAGHSATSAAYPVTVAAPPVAAVQSVQAAPAAAPSILQAAPVVRSVAGTTQVAGITTLASTGANDGPLFTLASLFFLGGIMFLIHSGRRTPVTQ